MNILAQRVGGSGHAGKHLHLDFEDGHIPMSLEGHQLEQRTLNLVLEVGYVFKTPTVGGATKEYISRHGETYYLQEIRLSVIDNKSRQALTPVPVPGLIHRNRPHPKKFDNVIEVIAPNLDEFLQCGLKDWFTLEGPFVKAEDGE